jgi:uncharacterized membrane protein YgcG
LSAFVKPSQQQLQPFMPPPPPLTQLPPHEPPEEVPTLSDDELAAMSPDALLAKADELRAKAGAHFQAGRVLLHAAQEAMWAGDEARFWQLMARSKAEKRAGHAFNTEVNRLALRANNQGMHNVWTTDLHGLTAAGAVEVTAERVTTLSALAGSARVTLRIIPGRGLHSKDGVPVLRAAVLEYLREAGVPHDFEPGNDGVVRAHIGGNAQGGGGGGGGSGGAQAGGGSSSGAQGGSGGDGAGPSSSSAAGALEGMSNWPAL